MTLTKREMVAEIGQRTRLKNREVQAMIEALVDVWTETLVRGEKIELENFLVIEVRTIQRDTQALDHSVRAAEQPQQFRQVVIHTSKRLRNRLKNRA